MLRRGTDEEAALLPIENSISGQIAPNYDLLWAHPQLSIVDETVRKVDAWTARHRLAIVPFPSEPLDPFFNANRPEDLATAAALLAAESGRGPASEMSSQSG